MPRAVGAVGGRRAAAGAGAGPARHALRARARAQARRLVRIHTPLPTRFMSCYFFMIFKVKDPLRSVIYFTFGLKNMEDSIQV